jgi:hypothetical protein
MVTLNAPNGQVLADVSSNVDELIGWMQKQPDRPQFRFSQKGPSGSLVLKRDTDVDRVKDFLYDSYEIRG